MKTLLICLVFLLIENSYGKVTECEGNLFLNRTYLFFRNYSKLKLIYLVCEGVINKLRTQLPDNAQPEEIELEFKKWCKTAVGKEEKFVSSFNFNSNAISAFRHYSIN